LFDIFNTPYYLKVLIEAVKNVVLSVKEVTKTMATQEQVNQLAADLRTFFESTIQTLDKIYAEVSKPKDEIDLGQLQFLLQDGRQRMQAAIDKVDNVNPDVLPETVEGSEGADTFTPDEADTLESGEGTEV